MGKELYYGDYQSQLIFDAASEATNEDIPAICFGDQQGRINDTLVAQPALVALSIAEGLYLQRQGLGFDVGEGLSLGELSMLAIAKILPVEDTLELAQVRASVTARVAKEKAEAGEKGAMLVVTGPTEEELAGYIEQFFQNPDNRIANYNSRTQHVLSGHNTDIVVAQQRLVEVRDEKRRLGERVLIAYKLIETGGAFHNPYFMGPAVAEFEAALRTKRDKFRRPQFEVIFNNAKYFSQIGAGGLARYLSRQLVEPVYLHDSHQRLMDDGLVNAVEVGPDSSGSKAGLKVVSGIFKQDFPEIQVLQVGELVEQLTGGGIH